MDDEQDHYEGREPKPDDNSDGDSDADDGADGAPQADGDDDTPADADVLKLMGKQQQESQQEPQGDGVPQGVDAATWKQFQEFQAAQQAPQQQQPQQQEEPGQPLDFSLSEDEFDTVGWVNKEGATEAIKRAMAMTRQQVLTELKSAGMVTQEAVQQQLQQAYFSQLRATEMMIHLKDAVAEQPELYEWPEAFNYVLNKALSDPKIDPQEAVAKARAEYMKAFRVSGKVEATQKRGRQIDVRGEQKPPVTGKNTARSSAPTEDQDPTGLGALGRLYSRGR